MKLKDSEYKNSSLIGQIDSKNTKEKSKLRVKCFFNSFTEIHPVSARNVPKLPQMSLVEPRKKDGDLTISLQIDRKNRKRKNRLLLKSFANSFRKNPPICAGNVPKLPKMSLFEPREESQKRMGA